MYIVYIIFYVTQVVMYIFERKLGTYEEEIIEIIVQVLVFQYVTIDCMYISILEDSVVFI